MDKVKGSLVLATAAVFALSVTFSYMNTTGSSLFNHTIEELSRKYNNQATPAPIAFTIVWPTIYIWNVLLLGYLVVSLFLPADISPVKISPTLAPKNFFLGIIVTWLSTTGWLFAYDEENLELSLALLLLSALGQYWALGVSCKVVYDNEPTLYKSNKALLWLMRILVQNGLELPATWMSVASLLGLAQVLIYKDSPGSPTAILRGGLSMVDASTVVLCILMGATILWFVMENFVVEKYFRYNFTNYPVLILALGALVARLQSSPDAKQNFIVACVALSVAGVAFLARIGLTIYKFVKPSYGFDPYARKLIPTA